MCDEAAKLGQAIGKFQSISNRGNEGQAPNCSSRMQPKFTMFRMKGRTRGFIGASFVSEGVKPMEAIRILPKRSNGKIDQQFLTRSMRIQPDCSVARRNATDADRSWAAPDGDDIWRHTGRQQVEDPSLTEGQVLEFFAQASPASAQTESLELDR